MIVPVVWLGFALGPPADALDRLVQAHIAKTRVPGVSIAILEQGKVRKAKGYGFANLEHQVRTKPSTVFAIGSLTKQFVATAILWLEAEGKLSRYDQIGKWVQEAPEAWSRVTLEHLMNHTSGIKDFMEVGSVLFRAGVPPRAGELLDLLKSMPLEFEPGSHFKYSNSGYYLLALAIERASGKNVNSLLQEACFGPAGLKATGPIRPQSVVPHRAEGYESSGGMQRHTRLLDPAWSLGSGHLHSTAPDMALWMAALFGGKVIPAPQLQAMVSPTILPTGKRDYGYGWSFGTLGRQRTINHSGSIFGFNSHALYLPGRRFGVVVLTNSMGGQAEALAESIAKLESPDLR